MIERRALAHRRAALGAQADAPARRAMRPVPQGSASAPGKPPARSPPVRRDLLDRPGQPGFDRGRRGVDVMAVKAKPRLEPQRVARAKADRGDLGLRQQRLGKGTRHAVAGTEISNPSSPVYPERDTHRSPPCQDNVATSMNRIAAAPGTQPRQRGLGLRSLQRQQRAVGQARSLRRRSRVGRACGRYPPPCRQR